MTKEEILQQAEAAEKIKPAKKAGAEASVNEPVARLAKFGGFNFLESTVEGIAAMNPERKARKKAFLVEENSRAQRSGLRDRINLWIGLLSSTSSVNEMLGKAQERAGSVSQLLSDNQLTAVEAVRRLEQSYRNVMLFYKNTGEDKLANITIVNASHGQVTDLDNSRFIDYVANELKQNYDKLDLRKNYSLLVIPGYLGGAKAVDKWSKIAYDNKVMLYTDFRDLDQPDDVVDMFFNAGLAGGETYKANTCMACNWLIGRGKYSELGGKNRRS